MRRYSMRRPKPSRMTLCVSLMGRLRRHMTVQPARNTGSVAFLLPDRQPRLDFFDDVAGGIVRRSAVRTCHRNRNARLTDLQLANAMHSCDILGMEANGGLARNVRQYPL